MMKMKKKMQRFIVSLLSMVMVIGMLPAQQVFASGVQTTVIGNEYIMVSANNSTGRYAIRTVDGQPVRAKDQNSFLTFAGDDTSFTTFRINGTDYIFGNEYQFETPGGGEVASTFTAPVTVQDDEVQEIRTVWAIEGVEVTQILRLYKEISASGNSGTQSAGNVSILYEVVNKSGAAVEVGSRVLLDVMVGTNDGPAFQSGNASDDSALQRVEREYKMDPQAGEHQMETYWVVKDVADAKNPLATNVYGYGFNNYNNQLTLPDKMVVGHWNRMANTKYDYTVNTNLDFTTDTNDFGSADTAVAFYWDAKTLTSDPTNDGNKRVYETIYGLGEIIEDTGVFNINFLSQVTQMQTNDAQTKYLGDGVFAITAQVENLSSYDTYHSSVTATLTLEAGLEFAQLDSNGNVVFQSGVAQTTGERKQTSTFVKNLSAADIAEYNATGDENIKKVAPGALMTFTYYVVAVGKAWPTTRSYMIEVTSPELEVQFGDSTDESLKALSRSSRTDFVFLPPVGQAYPTYVYAMSPEETYYEDEKIITLNVSNIGAYSVGQDTSNANFRVFLKNVLTGEKVEVNVKESVLLIDGGDGSSGDIRINYRGPLVGGATVSDPTLDIGAYCVEVEFLSSNEEEVELYSFTTQQTFLSSENEETRMRTAGMFVIGKRWIRADSGTYNTYWTILTGLDAVAYALDSTYESYTSIRPKSGTYIPVYEAVLIEDEAALKAYRQSINENTRALDAWDPSNGSWNHGEVLLIVEGMIKEQDGNIFVDTSTEPAIINETVSYSGSDLAISEVTGLGGLLSGSKLGDLASSLIGTSGGLQFSSNGETFGSLSIVGDGTLSIASSGFVFHKGEWSVDFYNGFDKSLYTYDLIAEENDDDDDDEDDDEDNGLLDWAQGSLSGQINPMQTLTVSDVYFNRKSLFSMPTFSVAGFGISFNEFLLSSNVTNAGYEYMVSFGGQMSMVIVKADVRNVFFDSVGFYGIESQLKFKLDSDIGLLQGEDDKASGKITINHYRSGINKSSQYGIEFKASLSDIVSCECELSFKRVNDGRILPDVIIFGADLPEPGILVTGATYLTSLKGGLRELADTIANGFGSNMPLTLVAGTTVEFGIDPAKFKGDIEMTLKMTGIKFEGSMKFAGQKMLTHALIEAQWSDPWFVQAKASVDVFGWNVIVGDARIFVGQNVALNRVDFEGFVSAGIQIPDSVPVVGGFPLARVTMGLDNDKIYGSARVGIGPISVGVNITYYWSGGIDISLDGESLPDDSYVYLLMADEETGDTRVVGVGSGIKSVASSYQASEDAEQTLKYYNLEDGSQMVESPSLDVGVGGIEVNDFGKRHTIPVGEKVYSATEPADGILQVEYYGKTRPTLHITIDGIPQALQYEERGEDQGGAAAANTVYAFTQSCEVDGVTRQYIYIIAPFEGMTAASEWILTSSQTVDTMLLSAPRAAELGSVTMANVDNDNATLQAQVQADYVKAGDEIRFYLTQETLSDEVEYIDDGYGGTIAIDATSSPGVLIGAYTILQGDISGWTASVTQRFDLTSCEIMGSVEDVRTLLDSGKYYLRAEVISGSGYAHMTDDANSIQLTDPDAPNAVDGVAVENAGNGYFDVSFAPVTVKAGQNADDLAYAVDVYYPDGGDMILYNHLNGLLYAPEDLTLGSDGLYHISLGGWQQTGDGEEDASYTGLETGGKYVIRVRPVNVGDDGNYHYAAPVDSAETTLRVPTPPALTIGQAVSEGGYYSYQAAEAGPELNVTSSVSGTIIEVLCGEESYGEITAGEALPLEKLESDGTYCLELRATNPSTGDSSVTILYYTLDTIAPYLYLDSPVNGDRSQDGQVQIAGTTTGGGESTVTVYVDGSETGIVIPVSDDGTFNSKISVLSTSPTASLHIVTSDAAGNSNSTVVQVTNASYKVPQSIVLREVSALEVGDTKQLEVAVRYADGKDANGNQKYTEEVLTDLSDTTFETYMGSAATVSDTGNVTAVAEGASIVRATYLVNGTSAFEAMLVLRVTDDDGNDDNNGDDNGDNNGDNNGGGGIGGGGVGGGDVDGGDDGETGDKELGRDESQTMLNSSPIPAELIDDTLVITIDADQISGDTTISTTYPSDSGYELVVSDEAAQTLAETDAVLTFETPLGLVTVDPSDIGDTGFTITMKPAAQVTVNDANVQLAAGGEGVKITADGVSLASVDIAVPASIQIIDFTAVLSVDAAGNWTPVTWKLNMVGNQAYVSIYTEAEGTIVFAINRETFSDVAEDHWGKDAIYAASGKMFMIGVGGGRFSPAATITRGEYATTLLRVGGYMTEPITGITLPDVEITHWSFRPLAIAKKLGIMYGDETGNMNGEDPVTRAEAMVMVARLLRMVGMAEPLGAAEMAIYLSGFSDALTLPDWAMYDVALCIKSGIIVGSNGMLNHGDPLSRAECATIANRIDSALVEYLLG